jgi:DNA-binding winged helix-turn-helix (wHTH) protein/TolB-like protein/Tfp pilus assembly protein PilF
MTKRYRFDGWVLDGVRRELRGSDGHCPELSARAFDLLWFLVERPGQDVDKDQLLKSLWPRAVVDENNLNQAVTAVRRALRDTRAQPKYLLTVPGRGYRFIASAEVEEANSTQSANASRRDETQLPAGAPHASRTTQRSHRGARTAMIAGLAVVCAVVLGIVYKSWRNDQGIAARTEPASLAVLPFRPLLSQQSSPALELGMTDTLIARLSELPRLKVSSLSSVRRYARVDSDPLAAGRELDVDAVLDGSLLSHDGRFRMTARLLRVSDGQSLWSGQYEESSSNIFALQDSITTRVVTALRPTLDAAASADTAVRSTTSAFAYEQYASGLYNWYRRDTEGLPQAIQNFETAVAIDPKYVEAWAGLSSALAANAVYGNAPAGEAFLRSKQAAQRAVAIDPNSAQAQGALAHVAVQYDRDYRAGEDQYRRAIALSPNNAYLRMWRAINLMHLGQIDAALDLARQAQQIEPRTLVFSANLGMLLYYAGRYDEAVRELRRVLVLEPQFDHARSYLAQALAARGEFAAALQEFSLRRYPSPGSFGDPGRTYAKMGRRAEAQAEVVRLDALAAKGFGVAYDVATIHALLGEQALACAALERALQDHSQMMGLLRVDPALESMRAGDCYASVFRRLYGEQPSSGK